MEMIILYVLTIYLFWSLMVSKLLVEITKQKLCEIRDRVFLEQEHTEEYYELISSLNLLIRFSEDVSWQRLVFYHHFLNKKPNNIQIPSFKSSELNQQFFKSLDLMSRLLIQKSIILYTIVILFGWFKKNKIEQMLITPKTTNVLFNVARQSQYDGKNQTH